MDSRLRPFIETWRGFAASCRWLADAPVANYRIARHTQDMTSARDIIAAQFARFLANCRVSVSVDGILPPPGQGCVITYNEPSFVDVAAFCTLMWPYVDHASGTDLYAYFPFGRQAATRAGISLIARGNRQATDHLLAQMVAQVSAGQRISWGGEGRIHGEDGVGRFKLGASLIAIRAQVPIIPVTFYGGHQVMPLRAVRARPGHVQVRFGAPVQTVGIPETDARALADHLQSLVALQYAELAQERAPGG